jgi:hypothetical protein
MLSVILAWSFLSWMAHTAPKCASVTLSPTLAKIEWCESPAWVATLYGNVGLAACHDNDIFLSFDDDTVVHVQSVAEMQGVLRS